ncbi:Uu.00g134380.m01.CDS01 [Anthostomella pinea]|uniref:Uu.00g134380.m01.CDS01 n=1 Tax=Anthostomella pinea TaxID=933095 RepID=A0AAI8VPN8_9PEZI|nr:Uu.00g134380.m01.CDS01 [Anthostomella pinea]
MCKVQLMLCALHGRAIHGMELRRCQPLVDKGYNQQSGVYGVNTLILSQDEGCEGFTFPDPPVIIPRYPPFQPDTVDDVPFPYDSIDIVITGLCVGPSQNRIENSTTPGNDGGKGKGEEVIDDASSLEGIEWGSFRLQQLRRSMWWRFLCPLAGQKSLTDWRGRSASPAGSPRTPSLPPNRGLGWWLVCAKLAQLRAALDDLNRKRADAYELGYMGFSLDDQGTGTSICTLVLVVDSTWCSCSSTEGSDGNQHTDGTRYMVTTGSCPRHSNSSTCRLTWQFTCGVSMNRCSRRLLRKEKTIT